MPTAERGPPDRLLPCGRPARAPRRGETPIVLTACQATMRLRPSRSAWKCFFVSLADQVRPRQGTVLADSLAMRGLNHSGEVSERSGWKLSFPAMAAWSRALSGGHGRIRPATAGAAGRGDGVGAGTTGKASSPGRLVPGLLFGRRTAGDRATRRPPHPEGLGVPINAPLVPSRLRHLPPAADEPRGRKSPCRGPGGRPSPTPSPRRERSGVHPGEKIVAPDPLPE